MKLTVGPLPSAVYWRRRAVVLGALLVVIFVLVYSCSGPDGDASPLATASPTVAGAAPDAGLTPTLPTPDAGDPAEESFPPEEEPVGTGGLPATDETEFPTAPVAPAPADGTGCTDPEMSLVPVSAKTKVARGSTLVFRLKIKNIATRTCSRDVGSGPQELYIKRGATTIWSSDTCSTAKGSDVQSFAPGAEREYQASWNGNDSTKCSGTSAAGPVPPAGEYQLFGRLGQKVSDPLTLTLT